MICAVFSRGNEIRFMFLIFLLGVKIDGTSFVPVLNWELKTCLNFLQEVGYSLSDQKCISLCICVSNNYYSRNEEFLKFESQESF